MILATASAAGRPSSISAALPMRQAAPLMAADPSLFVFDQLLPQDSALLQVFLHAPYKYYSRRRGSNFTDIPSPSILIHLLKVQGGAAN